MKNQSFENEGKGKESQKAAQSIGLDLDEQTMNGNYGMAETESENNGVLHDEGETNHY